jgi:hypothetical protein
MRLYKLTNLSNTSHVIEDLGVNLPGKGSTCVVNADAADRSKRLASLLTANTINKQPHKNEMKIWPRNVQPKPPPEASAETSEVSELKREISKLGSRIDNLGSKLDTLISLVEEGVSSLSDRISTEIQSVQIQAQAPVKSRNTQTSAASGVPEIVEDPDEPMFIPSQIVPEGTKGRININEGEEKKDLSAAKSRLRAARKSTKK